METLESAPFVQTVTEPGSALRDFVTVVRRGLPLALGIGVLAAGLAYYMSQKMVPVYRATATLLISDTRPSSQFGVTLLTAPVLAPSAYEAAVRSAPVLDAARDTLLATTGDAPGRTDLLRNMGLDIEVDNPSTLMWLWAENPSPDDATAIANALSEALRSWDIQRARTNVEAIIAALEGNLLALDAQLERALASNPPDPITVQSLRDRRADNTVSLETARALQSSAVGYVELLEPALVPTSPISPSPTRNTALAFCLGAALAYVLILARLTLDTKFKDPDDMAASLGENVLAVFQKVSNRHISKETANFLRANVLSQLVDAHPKVILVTSARPGEGKTSVAIAMAESIARSNYRTLLVDADLRRPAVAQAYSLPGVMHQRFDDLLKDPRMPLRTSIIKTSGANLHVLAGRPASVNPSELLTTGFAAALETIKSQFDVVVIDSAPVLPIADTLSMVPYVTSAVFVVNVSRSDRKGVAAAVRLLRRLDTRLLGLVITGATKATAGGVEYGYGYEQEASA